MSKGKNNSIIFLTTLSVYLGLVLVGGVAPTVLAQAATTRNFNVQDEIEVKDDLDKKPGNDFPFLFVQLLNEIKREVENGKLSLPIQTDFIFDGNYNSCGGGIGSNVSDQQLSDLVSDAVNKNFPPKLYKFAKNGKIRFEANGTDLSLKVSFTESNAELVAQSLNQEFYQLALSAKNTLTKQVYENTKATFENSQVFIVTRLPRGSLDKFLKQNAKAESK